MRRFTPVLFLFLTFPALAAEFPARVVGISDGDTLTVLIPEKRQVKVRLWGVDAPETGQDFGQRAKQAASDLAFGKNVTVKERDRDRYGRTVAEVILPDGTNLNRELVERGMAWHFKRYAPNDVILNRAEVCARKVHLGLWSQPNPIAPWDWRKGVGVPLTAGFVGNKKSLVYHSPHCRAVAAMKDTNRVSFATYEAAEKAGYRRAGDCR